MAEVMLVGTARAIKTVAEQITRFDRFVVEFDCLSIVTPELSFEQLMYYSTLAWMSADNKTDGVVKRQEDLLSKSLIQRKS